MKKIVALLLFSGMIMFFTACEGPPGKDGYSAVLFSKNYTVLSDKWNLVGKVDEINSLYEYSIDISAVTNSVFTRGAVVCYLTFLDDEGEPYNYQTPLPYTFYNRENYDYSEHYTFDFMPGSVVFYVVYSDFNTSIAPPSCMFRVVVLED